MSYLITGLTLGLVSSLHCLGMCGPLLLLMHSIRGKKVNASKNLVYHLGRILIYTTMGVIAGTVGESLSLFGWQRKIAIVIGILVMLLVLIPAGNRLTTKLTAGFVQQLKEKFHHLIRKGDFLSQFLMGALNGMLPCGAVYIALASAIAFGSVAQSSAFMAVFGLGTLPVLFATSTLLDKLRALPLPGLIRKLPVILALTSVLIILRGADLGIPFLSPNSIITVRKWTVVISDVCFQKPRLAIRISSDTSEHSSVENSFSNFLIFPLLQPL